ncbi:hypothetical protein ACSBR2_021154 [Camellia fascicularis]
MAEDGFELGFEEGMSWLPTHVACHSKEYLRSQRHQQNGGRLNIAAESLLPQAKCSMRKPNHRARNPRNWGAGNGMQAVFLDSSSSAQTRSCGTGVFLPRKAGSPFHPTKKPGCSPVLLPSRVVQALNLNVHELGLQIKPPQDTNKDSKRSTDCNAITRNKKGNKDDATAQQSQPQYCVISRSRSNSPEIFLPKEWTY